MAKRPKTLQSFGVPVGAGMTRSIIPATTKRNLPKATQKMAYNNGYHPFGPDMAGDIFNVRNYGYDYEECASYEEKGIELDGDKYQYNGGEIESYHYNWQPMLDLEPIDDIRNDLKRRIERYTNAHHKMAFCALKWHYLMEDLESNEQLKKQFMDIQLQRKLGGSKFV